MALNTVINKLPFELHVPTYSFCGPGTRLRERVHQPGKNPLDEACKLHDIAYHIHGDSKVRHQADKELADRARARVKAADASIGEKTVAWFIANIMTAKRKLGLGRKSFNKYTQAIRSTLRKSKVKSPALAAKMAHMCAKKLCGNVKTPRIVTLPKQGGVLPLIPIFAALSALGALTGGASSIMSTVKRAQAAQKDLEEAKRHNKTIEAIALGKGMFLKPYRRNGLGLFLKPYRGMGKKSKNYQRCLGKDH